MAIPGRKLNAFPVASATGASQVLLEENLSAGERIIAVPVGQPDWTINLVGGTAAAGAVNCVLLGAGDMLVLHNTNQITGIGTAAATLTVLEG